MTAESYNGSIFSLLLMIIILCIIGLSCCRKVNYINSTLPKTAPITPISSPHNSTEEIRDGEMIAVEINSI